MIGGFVVIAVFLLATSVVLFGSGKFFKKTDKYVLYFDTSIKGLSVGAPVLFNGVAVGAVTEIVVLADHEKLDYIIPVYIDIDPNSVLIVDGEKRISPEVMLPKLIDRGLRGVLTTQSFITGQLMIELAYYPETPAKLKYTIQETPEIPTIPSTTERLFQILQQSDFKGMMNNLEQSISGISKLVNDPEIINAIHSFRLAADNVKNATGKIDAHIDPLAQQVDGTLSDSRKLLHELDSQVEPLSSDLKKTTENFNKLILSANADLDSLTNSIEKSLEGFRGISSENAPIIIQAEETLQNISAMSRSLRQLADYLERHPESILMGKEN